MKMADDGDKNKDNCQLWVLRRWNSFTPRVPVGEKILGGGYLLRWNGWSLAIDPGFDFLENLYRVPKAIGDIDAILITHGHVDHRAEIEVILMMKRERNQRISELDRHTEQPLRMILSSDALVQLMPLLQAQEEGVVNVRDIITLTPNANIDLRHQHGLTIDTFKTNHSDYSVGLVLRLWNQDNLDKEWLSIGMTSDTGYDQEMKLGQRLSNCKAVIAHLGTVSTKRLIGMARLGGRRKLKEILRLLKTVDPSYLKQQEAKMISKDILESKDTLAPDVLAEELLNVYQGSASYYDQPIKNHLEFGGLLHLFEEIFFDEYETKIGVISEFGEELGSFRHKISDSINRAILLDEKGRKNQRVLTGDIGLCLTFAPKETLCERFSSGEQCVGSNKETCKEPVTELVQCTRCREAVPIRCIDEICIRHRNEGIYYNCPQCFDREISPPSGPMIPLIGHYQE